MTLPIINLSLLPSFPAVVVGEGPVVVTKAGLTYTFGWDISAYSLNPSADVNNIRLLGYNTSTLATELYNLSDVQSDFQIVSTQITDSTTTGRSVLTGNAAAGRLALEVQPGTDVQAYSASLANLAGFSTTGSFVYLSATDTWSAVTIGSGLTFGTGSLSWNGVNVRKNSTGSVFTRRRINLIEGTGITLTVADDSPNDEVDVTITAPSGTPPVYIQRKYAEYKLNTALTTQIPGDDTIPQNTEGTEILSVSITPTSATNRLRIRTHIVGSHGTTTGLTTSAVFSSASANAISAVPITQPTAFGLLMWGQEYEYVPGVTTALTISVRVGPSSGTFHTNGNSGGRFMGGASACTLVVEEITP